ncbi:hypothetical protein HOLleu_05217 [Holothuria leucospilota]|uniref:Uncharacterized protein n=1 Tax=Holothuria leucospilota TaxID=206669 RepID=A0A9Q1CL29_HOLLE|nr:hypothetical protein HOLleu_05217 [Holothuria leucospilota]
MSKIPTRKNVAPPPKKKPVGSPVGANFGVAGASVVHSGVGRARVRVLPPTVPEPIAERRRQMVKASEAKIAEEERVKSGLDQERDSR